MILSARTGALHHDPAFDVSSGGPLGAVRSALVRGQAARQSACLDNGGATFPRDLVAEERKRFAADKAAKEEKEGAGAARWQADPKKIRSSNRWRLKAKIRRLLRPEDGTRGPSVCGCGAVGHEIEEVSIHLRSSGATATGVFKCDSPWLCPSCAPARAKRRQERLEEVIGATQTNGGSCAFVTLTIRHDLGLRLADAKRLVSEASRRARQGRRWMDIKAEGQLLGVVQGVEVLHSVKTGWHYHMHLILPGLGSKTAVMRAARKLVVRYIEEVKALGAIAKRQGQDVQLIASDDVGKYASKGSASWEVAGGAKEARSAKSRTPWDLATLAATGDEEAKALFAEYAAVMPGTRSCVVSAALAKALEIQVDEDADEPSVETPEILEEIVGQIGGPLWTRLWGRGRGWMILKAVEKDFPWERVHEMAMRLGAEYSSTKPVNWVDIKRVVTTARARAGSNAAKSVHIEAAIAEQRAEAARRGRLFEVTDRDRSAIEAEFIRQGLESGVW